MKTICLTQRVDIHPDYGERRDALDQKWTELLLSLECICVPLPNNPDAASGLLSVVSPDAILLTGGNDPAEYGGAAPERDSTDKLAISYAEQNRIPLLGVCRGMQSVVLYFGGTLQHVEGHIAIRHKLDTGRSVNSYHAYAPHLLPEALTPLAYSTDGHIEQLSHKTLPIWGVMWHPERENPFNYEDLSFLRGIFGL